MFECNKGFEIYPFKGSSDGPRAEHMSCCVHAVLQCNAAACAKMAFEGKIQSVRRAHFETTPSSGAKYGHSSPVTKRSTYSAYSAYYLGVQKSSISWYVVGFGDV